MPERNLLRLSIELLRFRARTGIIRAPADCARPSADPVYFDMKTAAKFLSGMLFLLACGVPASGGVVINEIMYHPASTNVLEEWIELHNSGTTNMNLSGWRITKGLQITFP